MPLFHPKTLLDKSYEVGIILKGINGLLELVGGILILALSPHTITGVTRFLTQDALQDNPQDFIANHVAHFGYSLAAERHYFAATFLLIHGIVKIVLVTCLLLNKTKIFPYAIAILTLFLVYQIYLFIIKPSFGLALLSVIDAIIVWLIWRERQEIRHQSPTTVD